MTLLVVALSFVILVLLSALVLLEVHHRQVQIALIDRITEQVGARPISEDLRSALSEEVSIPLRPNKSEEKKPPRRVIMPQFPDPGVVLAMRRESEQRQTNDVD